MTICFDPLSGRLTLKGAGLTWVLTTDYRNRSGGELEISERLWASGGGVTFEVMTPFISTPHLGKIEICSTLDPEDDLDP